MVPHTGEQHVACSKVIKKKQPYSFSSLHASLDTKIRITMFDLDPISVFLDSLFPSLQSGFLSSSDKTNLTVQIRSR